MTGSEGTSNYRFGASCEVRGVDAEGLLRVESGGPRWARSTWAVDPSAVRTGQEGDRGSDVLGRTELFERVALANRSIRPGFAA